MMHGLLEILNQRRQSSSSQQQGFDLVSGVFSTIKAIQAAVTLGTSCSSGLEGPSVYIGKSCAIGFSLMMENNRVRKIVLVAAGAAFGITSGTLVVLLQVCNFQLRFILLKGLLVDVNTVLKFNKTASSYTTCNAKFI